MKELPPPSLEFVGITRTEIIVLSVGLVVLLLVISRVSDLLARRRIERMQREDTGIDWRPDRRR